MILSARVESIQSYLVVLTYRCPTCFPCSQRDLEVLENEVDTLLHEAHLL